MPPVGANCFWSVCLFLCLSQNFNLDLNMQVLPPTTSKLHRCIHLHELYPPAHLEVTGSKITPTLGFHSNVVLVMILQFVKGDTDILSVFLLFVNFTAVKDLWLLLYRNSNKFISIGMTIMLSALHQSWPLNFSSYIDYRLYLFFSYMYISVAGHIIKSFSPIILTDFSNHSVITYEVRCVWIEWIWLSGTIIIPTK